jgi:tRNA modification GTPase
MSATICAPATPPVPSPIAIIRISGPDSLRAALAFFRTSSRIKPRYAYYGTFFCGGADLDDVVLIYYEGPASFTGEDMVEIFCHGNPLIVRRIINLLASAGVTHAQPGEFSKRAFLNGKTDLTGAEAINHIICAKSDWEIETSIRQMHGSFRKAVEGLRAELVQLKADVEAMIDFSEEEITFVSVKELLSSSEGISTMIKNLASRCRTGEKLSHGLDITIAGRTNVGKSSLLNLIVNSERAIVSDIPGTTRDVIREHLQIDGIAINLHDTAGLGSPGDEIEKIGMEKSRNKIDAASLVLLVIDACAGINDADLELIDEISPLKRICVINKIDLVPEDECRLILSQIEGRSVLISAKTGDGLEVLKRSVRDALFEEFADIESSFVADLRIIKLLESARAGMEAFSVLVNEKSSPEILAFELERVNDHLSEITGEISPDSVLDSIFSRFCIGK